MTNFKFIIISLFVALSLALVSCGSDEPTYTPPNENGNDNDTIPNFGEVDKQYKWERNRTSVPTNSDAVLLYGGSHHRKKYLWNQNRVESCVAYKDEQGVGHWLFDSFILIEFSYYIRIDIPYRDYYAGFSTYSARKSEWEELLNYWFSDEYGIGAIDAAITAAKKKYNLDDPSYKHQVILTMPEPIRNEIYRDVTSKTKYWGEVDGRQLDFARVADQYAALKWYVDEARARFNKMNYQNIDLAGFYWVSEESDHATEAITKISEYLSKYKYSFNWIPWFRAPGYDKWKITGFNTVYYQPGYFFRDNIGLSRFEDAFNDINAFNMGLEIEFNSDVVKNQTSRYCPERLRDYFEAAKKYGAWYTKRIAYYHDDDAIYQLANSSDPDDQQLYNELCQFVTTRPCHRKK